jgi:hypothetical protein
MGTVVKRELTTEEETAIGALVEYQNATNRNVDRPNKTVALLVGEYVDAAVGDLVKLAEAAERDAERSLPATPKKFSCIATVVARAKEAAASVADATVTETARAPVSK